MAGSPGTVCSGRDPETELVASSVPPTVQNYVSPETKPTETAEEGARTPPVEDLSVAGKETLATCCELKDESPSEEMAREARSGSPMTRTGDGPLQSSEDD